MYELYLHDFCLDFDENEDEAIEGDNIEDEPGSNEPFVDSPDINSELLGYRCATHTLQLAILDALKNVSTRTLLELARRVCKCLKNQNIMISIRNLKQKNPILDSKTRWCSSCDMIGRLLELRNFCDGISAGNPDVKLTEDQWNRLAMLFEALQPAKIATKKWCYL